MAASKDAAVSFYALRDRLVCLARNIRFGLFSKKRYTPSAAPLMNRRDRRTAGRGYQVKSREPRRKVFVKARMRVARNWGDALILNISSRGLLIQTCQPPRRGTYFELRRGRHVIVARAVWVSEDRFGAETQDQVAIEAVLNEPDGSVASASPAAALPDRRSVPRRSRTGSRHEDSRLAGRLLEFACCIVIVAGAASMAFVAVEDALASPMRSVTAALD
jgi:hypothetical protein